MENEYDNEVFFAQYAQMERSKGGLKCAGEWHLLEPMFPDLHGKAVLDLGCGYGWHCKYAEERGAAAILGIDLSKKMLAAAEEKNGGERISYRNCGIEVYEYPENAWDMVISNLALHYIADLDRVFRNVYRTLRADGTFLLNIEHPVFTAGVHQDWVYRADGSAEYWPVDDYYKSGRRVTRFLGCEVVKQHHTLTQILMGLRNAGFTLDAVEEVTPPAEMMHLLDMADELRRPMMLLVKAEKA